MTVNNPILERNFTFEEVKKLLSLAESQVFDICKKITDHTYTEEAKIDFHRKSLRLHAFPNLVLDDIPNIPIERASPMSYNIRNLWYKLLIYKHRPLSSYSDEDLVYEVLEQIMYYKWPQNKILKINDIQIMLGWWYDGWY